MKKSFGVLLLAGMCWHGSAQAEGGPGGGNPAMLAVCLASRPLDKCIIKEKVQEMMYCLGMFESRRGILSPANLAEMRELRSGIDTVDTAIRMVGRYRDKGHAAFLADMKNAYEMGKAADLDTHEAAKFMWWSCDFKTPLPATSGLPTATKRPSTTTPPVVPVSKPQDPPRRPANDYVNCCHMELVED